MTSDPQRHLRQQRWFGAVFSVWGASVALATIPFIGVPTLLLEATIVGVLTVLTVRLIARRRRPRPIAGGGLRLRGRRVTSLLSTSLGNLEVDAHGFRYWLDAPRRASAQNVSVAWEEATDIRMFAENRLCGYFRLWVELPHDPGFVEFVVWGTMAEVKPYFGAQSPPSS